MVVSVFAVRLFQLQGVDAQAYVAKARAEGVVTVDLPATRGTITDRNGVALANSVDGLMLVADPTVTVKHASEIATIIARRLDVDYFDVLTRLRKPYTRFQYIARRVPATQARAVLAAIDRRGYKGIDLRRDPLRSYPADDVAANVVGFVNEAGNGGDGAELLFDKQLSGTDGTATYEVGGGNRIPLGDNSTVAGAQRQGPAAHHRPRRAVVHPAGAPLRRPGVPRPVRLGRRDGHPHRRAARRGGLPDVRPQPALPVEEGGHRRAGAARRLRARVGREGAHRLVPDRRRQGHPEHPDHRPQRAARCRTG